MPGRTTFLLSLPERLVRSVFALVGGGVHETAELLLPRLVRRSRLYEATAKNLLRASIEVVGGVEAPDAFVQELKVVGVLAPDAHLRSVDDLLAALSGGTGTAARLIGGKA